MNKLIYQFCLHNHRNHFEMLNRIEYTADNYKKELMPIGEHVYNLDFFKENKVVTLVDIIPHFMVPEIHSFDFQNYDSESEMMDEITDCTLDFIKNNFDPEKTLVIQLIHSIDPLYKSN